MPQINWGQAQQFRLSLGLVRSPLAVYTTGKGSSGVGLTAAGGMQQSMSTPAL